MSGVFDDVHRAPGAPAKLAHQFPDHLGHPGVERVDGLAGLKVGVGILRGAADARPLWRQRTVAVGQDQLFRYQGAQVVVGEHFDGVEFVRRAKAVEEVQERHSGAQRGRLGDQGQVVGLLHRGRRQQRETGLAHRHHILVVSEYRKALGGNRSCCDMDHGSGQLAGDLVHVRDHQQQALG